MNILPGQVRALHFIGIGGIGMSGIAEVLHKSGFQVQGADIAESYNTKRLQSLGIPIFIGHDVKNLARVQAVVISSAVKPDNVELQEARRLRIPVMHRSEILAEIMRSRLSLAVGGTHGKTTTTSLLAWLIDAAGMDPTVVNGGIINDYNTNARLGKSNWAVVEADESDGSFTRLPATIAVVTNIDPEHMEHYGDFESLYAAFRHFVKNVPFYGAGVLCIDHPTVKKLADEISERRIVTYGFDSSADVSAQNIRFCTEGVTFDISLKADYLERQRELAYTGDNVKTLPAVLKDVFLPMVGQHNVQNALAVVAIAQELGISDAVVRHAFKTFKGVKRRFTQVGSIHGVRVIDDYAHHPAEIKAVISAARQATKGKIYAVVQPHRFSRLKDLFEDFVHCFSGCDQVLIAPVYAAGESPNGVTSEDLVKKIAEDAKVFVRYFEYPSSLVGMLTPFLEPGDMVICMGAGNITTWAYELAQDLEKNFQPPLKAVNGNS